MIPQSLIWDIFVLRLNLSSCGGLNGICFEVQLMPRCIVHLPLSLHLRKPAVHFGKFIILQDAGMSNTRKLAYNAADKAQEALASAKAKLVGGPGTST